MQTYFLVLKYALSGGIKIDFTLNGNHRDVGTWILNFDGLDEFAFVHLNF